jgi:hypothetical protein
MSNKRNTQSGDVEIVIVAICFTLCLALLLICYFINNSHVNTYNRWVQDCKIAKGEVQIYGNNRQECEVNGKKVVLPGWESYQ